MQVDFTNLEKIVFVNVAIIQNIFLISPSFLRAKLHRLQFDRKIRKAQSHLTFYTFTGE